MSMIAVPLTVLFMLVTAGLVVLVAVCGEPGRRSATTPAPGTYPGFAGREGEQNPNSFRPAQGVYGLPAPAAAWPGMWVGPAAVMPEAAPTEVAPQPPYSPVVQQRRQLSCAARRVTVHGARR
jgi:hypothetical protein